MKKSVKKKEEEKQTKIKIIGAKEHNLKNISLEIPKNQFVVVTGVSGSGKSSLAFDTIFAEGQRRYIESLSSYARQFLGQLDKPDVEHIAGLSPAVSIDQKSKVTNIRSTVGTVTEIYDHLRLLFARIGKQHCPVCQALVQKQTIDQIVDSVIKNFSGEKGLILAPVVQNQKGEFKKLFSNLNKQGFLRVIVDGNLYRLEEEIKLAKTLLHTIDLVVDRIKIKEENRARITDSFKLALEVGKGFAKFLLVKIELENLKESSGEINNYSEYPVVNFSENLACPNGHGSLGTLAPKNFSFNSPEGACQECQGIGFTEKFDLKKIIPDPSQPVLRAIEPWAKSSSSYYQQILVSLLKHFKLSEKTSWQDLSPEIKKQILYGTKNTLKITYDSFDGTELISVRKKFPGVIKKLEEKYQNSRNEQNKKKGLEKYLSQEICPSCNGGRLKEEFLAVRIDQKNISEICELSIKDSFAFFKQLRKKLSKYELTVVDRVLQEITARLDFLLSVGLDYLTLARAAKTLSGGESQRIRLATQIGSGLTGVIYVLDEPSIGLHQRDNDRLIETLKNLRDLNNTLVVVEHDEDTIRQADFLVDIGPKAGKEGGKVVATGQLQEIMRAKSSITGKYLSGKLKIELPSTRREGNQESLYLINAKKNNLKNLDVEFPLGKLILVTGVSGSGKSSLIMDELLPNLKTAFRYKQKERKEKIIGLKNIDKVIEIDQGAIGKTSSSNPATYIGVFTPIREVFASLPESKQRGFSPGQFSFNVKGGRCEACSGQGYLEIEMNFLPSVFVKCDVCQGKRYNKETLEVKFKEHTIYQVLNLTVREALVLFEGFHLIQKKLEILNKVGLGYIKLGQPAPTLSGGEAQRIKLASELSKTQTGKTLYILDEPTTGLHWDDVNKLIKILNQLTDYGNTVIVIEHNLDVIKQADWIIDLGPKGGDEGGKIIAEGTPELISAQKNSETGKYLKRYLTQKSS